GGTPAETRSADRPAARDATGDTAKNNTTTSRAGVAEQSTPRSNLAATSKEGPAAVTGESRTGTGGQTVRATAEPPTTVEHGGPKDLAAQHTGAGEPGVRGETRTSSPAESVPEAGRTESSRAEVP